jgi:hypothetical protein
MQKQIATEPPIPIATRVATETNIHHVTATLYVSPGDPLQMALNIQNSAYEDYKNNCVRQKSTPPNSNLPRRLLEKLETSTTALLTVLPTEDTQREHLASRLSMCQQHAFDTFRVLTPSQLARCFQKQLDETQVLTDERLPDSDIPSFMVSEYLLASQTEADYNECSKNLIKTFKEAKSVELIYCIASAYQQIFSNEKIVNRHSVLTHINSHPNRYKTQCRQLVGLLTTAIKNSETRPTHRETKTRIDYLKSIFPELKKALRNPLFSFF